MEVREGLYYSRTHEWVRVEGDKVYIGITDHAQHELGDIVFVELPDVDGEYGLDDRLAVIESVKAVADAHCVVTGRVVEVNSELEDSPEMLNQDAFGAWIAVLELTSHDELKQLMCAEEYRKFVTEA